MKLKIFSLLLAISVVFSFVACSSEDSDPPKKDLTGLKDEEVIEELLSDYEGLRFSAATYKADLRCAYAGSEVTVGCDVSVKGDAFSLSSVTSFGEISETVEMVFTDGILYLNLMGEKTKASFGRGQASQMMEEQLPFVLNDLSVFGQQDLLRGEEGSYVVVLSEPTEELVSVLELDSFLPEVSPTEEEEDSEDDEEPSEPSAPEFSRLNEAYLSLAYDGNGVLQKVTLGVTAVFLDNGMESEMQLDVSYRILTTNAAQIEIKPPVGLSDYEDVSGETPDTDDGGNASSDTNDGGDTTDAED